MNIIDTLPPDIARRRIMKAEDAAAFCGVSVNTLRNMRGAGTIPAPIQLSERRIGWRIGDLLDWQDCRESGRAWKDCQGAKAA
ncbi:helix-turn-helix transcriptional regulator [Methylobacterium sp. NPDC080182]|uniref:helix-turn-helix transcriptional regulator n=1 Tax=Methylobacterium sp. NPDC080182 TaxID=3390590 RepID=UPI003D073A4D